MIIFLLIVYLLLICVVVFYLILFADAVFGGLNFASSKKTTAIVAKIVNHFRGEGFLIDLGCSDGKFLLGLRKIYQNLNLVGIDNSLFRISLARFKSRLKNAKITFYREDLFKTDISKANIIYIYLDKSLLPSLEQKFEKEMKQGAMVVSCGNPLPGWKILSEHVTDFIHPNFQKLFVYKKT